MWSPRSRDTTNWCQTTLTELRNRPGSTELQQLMTSLRITLTNYTDEMDTKTTREFYDEIVSNLQYDVRVRVHDNCVALLVRDVRPQKLRFEVDGGSGFHTIAEGDSIIDYCPFIDYGDNSYAIFCQLYDRCADVTSHLLLFNYLAYINQTEYPITNKKIFHRRICKPPNYDMNHLNYYESSLPGNGLVYWAKSNASTNTSDGTITSNVFKWHLHHHHRQTSNKTKKTQQLTDQQQVNLMACKNSTSLFHFIGDSHARNLAYHVIRLSGNLRQLKRIHNNLMYDSVDFHWAAYIIDTFLPSVRKVLMSVPRSSKGPGLRHSEQKHRQVLVMDVGCWDVTWRGVEYFASVAIPAMREQFRDMNRRGLFSRVAKVIFFNMPPMPIWSSSHVNRRNPMVAAAGNRLLADVIGEFSDVITYVDYFSLTRVFINETAAPGDCHYLIVNTTASLGHVGLAVANYIIQLTCQH
jgi:hypothetical protein